MREDDRKRRLRLQILVSEEILPIESLRTLFGEEALEKIECVGRDVCWKFNRRGIDFVDEVFARTDLVHEQRLASEHFVEDHPD